MGITDSNPNGKHKTLIIVVAKMLRGSNPPWSFVLRCDDYSSFRIKTYTWFLVPVEFDFELKKGRTNLSLIPVLPIGSY